MQYGATALRLRANRYVYRCFVKFQSVLHVSKSGMTLQSFYQGGLISIRLASRQMDHQTSENMFIRIAQVLEAKQRHFEQKRLSTSIHQAERAQTGPDIDIQVTLIEPNTLYSP